MVKNKNELVIITGLSGAGKSVAANALEDIGFYCIDNIPPMLIPSIIELTKRGTDISKIAVITDLRAYDMFDELGSSINLLKSQGNTPKVVFLDASDEQLILRYKENRRTHPLKMHIDLPLPELIIKERELLSKARSMSDYIIDTTNSSSKQLKLRITNIFQRGEYNGINIQCMSFGYKHGCPHDADLMFDVRCLPNPFYIEALRPKTGLNTPVSDYVMSFNQSKELYKKIEEFIDFTLPLYVEEGKSQLVIAIGCTGGKHRSVTIAERLYNHLKEKDYNVGISHRDISKE